MEQVTAGRVFAVGYDMSCGGKKMDEQTQNFFLKELTGNPLNSQKDIKVALHFVPVHPNVVRQVQIFI